MEVWTKEAVKGVGLLVRDDDEKRLSYEGSNYAARTKIPDDDAKCTEDEPPFPKIKIDGRLL